MIRREIHFDNHPPQWLLISQVEHARLSGILAEHCLHHLGQLQPDNPVRQDLHAIRQELTAAIVHHDDGWAHWESQPQLDAERGRPLSFLELPLPDTLRIWTDSIEVAETIGPLSAWIVAGHFKILLEDSEENRDKNSARDWLGKIEERRNRWLSNWHQVNLQRHTPQLAKEALLWLRLCDILSLWICMTYPSGDERIDNWPDSYTCGEGLPLQTVIKPSISENVDDAAHSDRLQVVLDPWRFDTEEISLDAVGQVVPVQKYHSGAELIAAHHSRKLSWQLVSATSDQNQSRHNPETKV